MSKYFEAARLLVVFVVQLGACSSDPAPVEGGVGASGAAGEASGAAGATAGKGSYAAGASFGGAAGSAAGGGSGSGGFGAGGGGGSAGSTSAAGSAGSTSAAGSVAGGAAGAGSGGSGVGGSGGRVEGGADPGGSGGGGVGQAPTTVWIAGDSTVQSCSSACPCGWGGELDELFNEKVKVVNRAIGGRSIQTWLREPAVTQQKLPSGECALSSEAYSARWNEMLNTSTGMKEGDTLIIQFGINDGDASCPRHVGNSLYATYLTQMARAARERGARPIYVTPTSAIECSGSSAVVTRGFVDTIEDAGTRDGVPVIDLHQLSIDWYNQRGFCPNDGNYSSGKVGEFFCDDHTHFDAPGAKQIAALVAAAIQAQKLPLAAYLK